MNEVITQSVGLIRVGILVTNTLTRGTLAVTWCSARYNAVRTFPDSDMQWRTQWDYQLTTKLPLKVTLIRF